MRPLVFALLTSLAAGPALAADGAKLFNTQCKVCHGAATSTPMGPSLKGAAGGRIAAKADFKYSDGLKKKAATAKTWTDANLDAFLTNPGAFAPGTRMAARVATPENRAAIIAHLKTLK